jgi:hypothetical protein
MKNKIYILNIIATLFFLTACSDFGDMNLDPNKPSSPSVPALLTSSLKSIADILSNDVPILYVQHLSEKQYTEASRYQGFNFDFNGWYSGPLNNLEKIIELNGSGNSNQVAVARILKAYFFHFMTDRWGALPYSESLKAANNFKPKYDTQEEIYNALFVELKDAVEDINLSGSVTGDFIFGGNMQRWKEFGNTVRMIMAIRISKKAPTKAKTEFEAAYNSGVISENVMYPYLAETNNQNPWYASFLTRYDYVPSNTFIDYLTSVNDPRLPAFADPAANSGTYVGMPYGIADAGNIPTTDVATLTDAIINTQDAPLAIFTKAQVEFYLAEAVKLGWGVTGTAQSHYEAGIRASMEQWGVFNQTNYNNYIAQNGVAWNDANAMQLIGRQKWVALFLQGFEAWAEWRRTNYPALTPSPEPLNDSGNIPVRQAYPTSEFDLNKDNYQRAISVQGADDLDTKLWWDVD